MNCYPIEGEMLTRFMHAISFQTEEESHSFSPGNYTLDEDAVDFLDANKFFSETCIITASNIWVILT